MSESTGTDDTATIQAIGDVCIGDSAGAAEISRDWHSCHEKATRI